MPKKLKKSIKPVKKVPKKVPKKIPKKSTALAIPEKSGAGHAKLDTLPMAKEYIIASLARFVPLSDIQEGLREEFGVTVGKPAILYYSRKYPQQVASMRQSYLRQIDKLPLRHKMVRVKELMRMYASCTREVLGTDTFDGERPQDHLLQQAGSIPVFAPGTFRMMMDLLAEMRREVGDDILRIDKGDTPVPPEMRDAVEELTQAVRKMSDMNGVLAIYDKLLQKPTPTESDGPIVDADTGSVPDRGDGTDTQQSESDGRGPDPDSAGQADGEGSLLPT